LAFQTAFNNYQTNRIKVYIKHNAVLAAQSLPTTQGLLIPIRFSQKIHRRLLTTQSANLILQLANLIPLGQSLNYIIVFLALNTLKVGFKHKRRMKRMLILRSAAIFQVINDLKPSHNGIKRAIGSSI
jgi:hypothetical protein